MNLDETLQKMAAAPTVADAVTELLACVTSAMRDVEAMSEWTELADVVDAHATDFAAAVAAAGAPPAP